MGSKRIEQSIEELYEFIEGCKPKGIGGRFVIVEKEAVFDLLDEMKLKIPDEINRCNKVYERKDQILNDAKNEAEKLISDAKVKAEAMVHDSEIMRQAYLQANEFISRANQQAEETVNNANYEANVIRNGAYDYTREMLSAIETVLRKSYDETREKSEMLLEALGENLDIVHANITELNDDVAPEKADDDIPEDASFTYEGEKEESDDEDDFNVNPDSFLKNIE